MKCPKCHYLSFDPEPRCRNCGYTLSLDPDLAIKLESTAAETPLADLALRDDVAPAVPPPAVPRRITTPQPLESSRRARTSAPGPFDDEGPSEFPSEDEPPVPDVPAQEAPPSLADPVRTRPAARPPATAELPLFVKARAPEADDEVAPAVSTPPAPPIATEPPAEVPGPLIEVPADPVPPLAVRRPKPADRSRPRESEPPRLGPLDRDLLEGLQRIEHFEQASATAQARQARIDGAAGSVQRVGAALVDALLLGGLGAGLVWITLRWCGLTWAQASVLPVAPMVVFALVPVVGYLIMFTAASGQTVGKMLAGIRVVDAGDDGTGHEPVSIRQAIYRGLVTVPSVLAAGAGFIPALVGEGRAFHDRLTHTRVVRA
jgi:uncharacterized RDD family membrane protein YckC